MKKDRGHVSRLGPSVDKLVADEIRARTRDVSLAEFVKLADLPVVHQAPTFKHFEELMEAARQGKKLEVAPAGRHYVASSWDQRIGYDAATLLEAFVSKNVLDGALDARILTAVHGEREANVALIRSMARIASKRKNSDASAWLERVATMIENGENLQRAKGPK